MHDHIEKGQLVGPRLTATVAYLKGTCHCSFSTIRRFLRDVIGCDHFSAYRKYMKDFDVLVQFCIAHLIRELEYLAGFNCSLSDYGRNIRQTVRKWTGIPVSVGIRSSLCFFNIAMFLFL